MTVGFIFWLLMLLILIFGWLGLGPWDRNRGGVGLLLFVLLFLLGWKVFGFPIQG